MATTSPFKQQCPGCGNPLLIKDPKFIGKKAECPKCHNKFTIEDPSAAEVPIEVLSDTPVEKPATKTQPPLAAKAAAPAAKPPAPKPAAAPPKPAAPPPPVESDVVEAEAEEEPAMVERGFSSFKLTCPSCDAPITIKDPAQVNKKIECPRCKYRFVVEPPKGSSVAAEAPAEAKPRKKARFGESLDDRPKPKAASNNLVLILGIGLSVVAIALLGVGAFFIFFTGDDASTPTRPTGPAKIVPTTTQTVLQTKTETGPALPEISNLLLSDTDLVCQVAVKDLYNSIIGRAGFASPGSFRAEQIAAAVGHLPEEIERVVIGYRQAKGNGLVVVRTAKDIDLDKLKERLGLEPGSDSPFKRQEYFMARPSSWLVNVRRILAEAMGLPAPAGKPIAWAVRPLDRRTLVFSDLESMKEFLELNGQPKLNAAEAKGPKKDSGRYLSINANLKQLLDSIESKSPMISVAGSLEGQAAALAAAQAVLQGKLALLAEVLRDSSSLGMGLSLKDSISLSLGSDARNPALGKAMEGELHKFGEFFVQTGVPTEINGQQVLSKNINPNLPPLNQRPVQKLSFRTSSAGRVIVLDTDVTLGLSGNSLLYGQVLRPLVLYARGISDMAEQKPRLFELAGALQAWTKKNQKFPRGTAARKVSPLGRTATPDQRLSWQAELLPLLGHEEVYKLLKHDLSWRPEADPQDKLGRIVDENARLGGVLVAAFLDPESPFSSWWLTMNSARGYTYAATHYVGIAGVGLDAADYPADDPTVAARLGVFGYDRETALADIKDGPAATIAVLQAPPTYRRPWIAGGGATVAGVPESGSIKPFVCKEYQGKKGTFAIMADGSVRFIPDTISDEAFKGLCTIAGGEKVDLDKETILVPSPRGTSELKTLSWNR